MAKVAYWEQIEALAALMVGEESPLAEEEFTRALAVVFSAIKGAKGFAEKRQMLEVTAHGRVVQDILGKLPEDRTLFPSLEEISDGLLPVEWLWPGWIPLGMLSLLGAAPGAGKSFLALDLARRIITGEQWPDEVEIEVESRRVIYVDAENVPQLLNERADSWLMPKQDLFPMLPDSEAMMIDLCSEEDQDRLFEMCGDLDPAMVVVDSLGAASSKGENAVEEVRGLLAFLNTVASGFGTAVLLIHHLRKRTLPIMDYVSINDFRGSGHIVAMARSILGMSIVQASPEMDRNGPRRLEVVKTNLAQYPPPLGVTFRPMETGKGVILDYGEAPKRPQALSKVEQCAEWMLEALEEIGEPVKVAEMVEMAIEEGFSRRTLYRARDLLEGHVVNTEGRRHPENKWVLAGGDEGECQECQE